MANIATGLLGRFIPQSAGLSEDDRNAIARQGLLSVGLGLLGARNGGNFGASLADGLQSGLLAINKGVDNAGDQAYKRAMIANQRAGGTGMQEFGMLTKDLPEQDVLEARRIRLGLAPRAVTGAAKIQDVVGADNVTRLGIFDPMTQTLRVFDGQNWVPAGAGNMPMQSEVPAQANTQRMTAADGSPVDIGADIPPQVRAAILADPNAASYGSSQAPMQQPMPQANPGLFVSAPKQVTAGQVAAAEANARNASDLNYLGPTLGMKTNAAIQEAAGTTRAKGLAEAEVKREGDAAKRAKDASEALSALDGAEAILNAGIATGSGAGANVDKVAAFFGKSTVGAQDAARLKPLASILLQKVPRFEGPQSDKDVASYKEAAGNLADETLPRATRLAAAAEMRRLNQKYASQQAAPSSVGAPRRLKYNPATGKIE